MVELIPKGIHTHTVAEFSKMRRHQCSCVADGEPRFFFSIARSEIPIFNKKPGEESSTIDNKNEPTE